MRRPIPMREQGFGLLVFVLIVAAVSFGLVLGYTGVMVHEEAQSQQQRGQGYVDSVVRAVEQSWKAAPKIVDSPSVSNTTTAEQLLADASVRVQHGLKVELSSVLNQDGVYYRAFVAYLPSITDESNPPDLATFKATGVFKPCTTPGPTCVEPVFNVYSSLELEKELMADTQNRLLRIAYKAQSYFKARMLLDPERNIGVNYFRAPHGSCTVSGHDLGCTDFYTPLASMVSAGGYTPHHVAITLGLTTRETFTPWGDPIEFSNLEESQTSGPPFTMAFRAPLPGGGYKKIYAIQQL